MLSDSTGNADQLHSVTLLSAIPWTEQLITGNSDRKYGNQRVYCSGLLCREEVELVLKEVYATHVIAKIVFLQFSKVNMD